MVYKIIIQQKQIENIILIKILHSKLLWGDVVCKGCQYSRFVWDFF